MLMKNYYKEFLKKKRVRRAKNITAILLYVVMFVSIYLIVKGLFNLI